MKCPDPNSNQQAGISEEEIFLFVFVNFLKKKILPKKKHYMEKTLHPDSYEQ